MPHPSHNTTSPSPNSTNPSTRVSMVHAITIPSIVLMLECLAIRFYHRRLTYIGLDDWLMACAAILSLTIATLALVSCKFGLGYHIADLRPEWERAFNIGKMAFTSALLFCICVALVKISVCCTYLRLFPSRGNRVFCGAVVGMCGGLAGGGVVLVLLRCWDAAARGSGRCEGARGVLLGSAGLNVAADVVVYLWPVGRVWGVRLPWRERLGLVGVFGLGCVVPVVGVCRMCYLEAYFRDYETRIDAAIVYAIAITEMNAGIICGSLHSIKLVLAFFCPCLFAQRRGRESEEQHDSDISLVAFRSVRRRNYAETVSGSESVWWEDGDGEGEERTGDALAVEPRDGDTMRRPYMQRTFSDPLQTASMVWNRLLEGRSRSW
ncbi:uncharacterized protein BDZ99DRAFT_572363 [Mytilinidion resinicola]|uniref:Rhodopsin domain-containing protein n=1 Tax=Mytilinidion resinicola TaxID=574789 RepID=A0A6A6YIY0_9PEZI|nr:uncharacterized protein BDZ99DRAFT_572363 [Mytilinidion resinicola]KAF2808508.1 hypothetical protein BDZ99DRAFT_572363 [Mytilinidion resinicola]